MNEILKRRAAFILALSIPFNLLAGCVRGNSNNDKSESSSIIKEGFSNEDLKSFLSDISAITPIYNLEEVFLSEEEINSLIEASKNNQECDNEVLDVNDIYNSIIANSLNEEGLIAIDYEISLEEKRELDAYIKECLKEALENMLNKNEISLEDACVMKQLRIVIGKSEEDVWINYYENEKVLLVDYEKVQVSYNNYENENFRNNLVREGLIRSIQLSLFYPRLETCACRLEKGQTNISVGEGNVLDSLIKSTLHSGDNSDLGNVNRYLFDNLDRNNKHNLSVLLLLAVFKENRNIDDLFEITFNSDLEGLYRYFNLTTKEEVEKFYQITRTMEVLTTDNEYQDEFFTNTTSTYSTAFRDYVGYGYKADVFKLTIKDLMTSIASTKDLSKEEAMFLYKYVKHIILNNAGLNDSYYDYEPNFVNTIIAIENIFFNFLGKFYNISLEELDELYDDAWLYRSWNLEDGTDTHDIKFSKLLEKYPLLQFIEINYRALGSYIDNFDKSVGRR